MATAVFTKQPAETFSVALDFTGNLPSGTTLSSGTASAILISDSSDADSIILDSTTLTIDAGEDTATAKLKAGSAAGRYKVTYTLTLDNADILEEDIIVNCIET